MRFAATAFATAITIIDPVGMIPLTLVATAGVRRARQRIVNEAVLVAAAVILIMGLIGRAILGYLGITLPAFTIAGGILLFLIAIDMLFARPTGAKQTAEETREASEANNPAVFPLAIPMIAGPGTIATVLLLSGLTHGDELRVITVVLAYASALAVTWLCMSAATLLQRVIGKTGIHVVTRLLGIILAALAVQFVINGLAGTPFFTHVSAHGAIPKNTGPTPQRAALNFLDHHGPRTPVLLHTNRIGRLALVRFAHGRVEEDTDWTGALLVERFSFGWQVVNFIDARCAIGGRGIPPSVAVRLARGIPLHADDPSRECPPGRDQGPVADVEALRRLNQNYFVIPAVRVVGGYGLVDWALPGGGEILYKRAGTAWKVVKGGGGAFRAQDLRDYGVPPAIARGLSRVP